MACISLPRSLPPHLPTYFYYHWYKSSCDRLQLGNRKALAAPLMGRLSSRADFWSTYPRDVILRTPGNPTIPLRYPWSSDCLTCNRLICTRLSITCRWFLMAYHLSRKKVLEYVLSLKIRHSKSAGMFSSTTSLGHTYATSSSHRYVLTSNWQY